MNDPDVWQWWRDALAGKAPAIDVNSPQCGFYKKRDGKGGKWLPVMIRYDDIGELRCRVADDSAADPFDVWTWCAGNPISKEDAKHAFEMGGFPGDAPSIGDNSGELNLSEQIKEYADQALGWLRSNGVKSKTDSDKAANYRAELNRLAKEADSARELEKRPHDDAAKAVQLKWKPLVDQAKAAADEMRTALTVFLRDEEARLEAERHAKWQAEQKAITAAREAAEAEQAKLMRDDPIAALTSDPVELPDMPPPPEPVKVQAGGQRGRKTGLREITRYVVLDHAKALAFFADSSDVRELIQKLAERASKSGVAVPGVEARTEKVAA